MSADGAGNAGGGDLQFDKVDLASPGEARSCGLCRRPVAGEYFQIGHSVICGPCAATLSGTGSGAFPRALLFARGAALAGTIVWYAIIKFTGHEFGLLAIGVGLLVGKAVRKGGQGLGGGPYQALAMALTYLSITCAYVPLVLRGLEEANAGSILTALSVAFQQPFAGGSNNIMGLIIIGIGLYEAWKINRRIPLAGPFRIGPPQAPLAATPGALPPAAP